MFHILDRFCRPLRVPPSPASGVCGASCYATAWCLHILRAVMRLSSYLESSYLTTNKRDSGTTWNKLQLLQRLSEASYTCLTVSAATRSKFQICRWNIFLEIPHYFSSNWAINNKTSEKLVNFLKNLILKMTSSSAEPSPVILIWYHLLKSPPEQMTSVVKGPLPSELQSSCTKLRSIFPRKLFISWRCDINFTHFHSPKFFPVPCLLAPKAQKGIDKGKKSTRFWERCIVGWKYTWAQKSTWKLVRTHFLISANNF